MPATMQEGHNSVEKRGEQEAAAPLPRPDEEAHSEAAAASASKSEQHASLQPETLLTSQPPASMEVCIQARVLPPTCGMDTIAEHDSSSGPAGEADCQNQSAVQVWLPNTTQWVYHLCASMV